MRISRWILGPALVVSLVALPSVGADAAPKKDPDSGLSATPVAEPQVKLDGPKRGKAALKALAGRLGAAAAANKTTTKKLHDVLANDPTAWLSANGRLFYAEQYQQPTTLARTSTTASVPPAPEPLGSTFLLHSIPGGSDHTVYLDFDGTYLGPGGWTSDAGFKVGTYKGFSLDADYTTFSSTERAYIQHVWQVVSEKYAPFDIDVTTENPGSAAFNRSGPGDLTYGDHVVFTDVTTGSGAKPASVCPYGCDGLAFTGTFNDDTDNQNLGEPTWVYTNNYDWSSGLSGEIAAHEVGHTLGLHHDGLGTGDGDFGSGNDAYYQGDDVWTPVMGSGIGALTQFSKGEYPNASNTEDDFAVMQTFGVNLRSDDWGDTGSPSALGQQATYAEDGVLEEATDKDVFSIFRTCTSPLTAQVVGIGGGRTTDLQLRVLDAAGTTELGSDNPATASYSSTFPRSARGADAEVSLPTPPLGLMQIEVDGVGNGTPETGGYSDYGSVGQYHLTITGCSGTSGAVPSAPAGFNASQTYHTSTLTVSWAAPSNAGDAPVSAYRITGLPSGTVDVPSSQTSEVFTGLAPGEDYDIGVAAVNAYGAGPAYTATKHMATWTPSTAPKLSGSARNQTLTLDWTEPSNPGRAVGTYWTTKIYGGGELLDTFQSDYGYSGLRLTGVGSGHYKLTSYLSYDADSGSHSPSASTYVDVGPSAPRIGTASSGSAGGTRTATVRWGAPSVLRGSTITSYVIGAYKYDSSGHVVRVYVSSYRSASSRSYTWSLPSGHYRFKVQAHSTAGWSPVSGFSNMVTSQ